MSKPRAVEINIGEQASLFAQRNYVPMKIDRQPAGLNFYQVRFPTNARGHAIINFAKNKFLIEHVLSITGTEDVDLAEEGLSQFHINSAITERDSISHDEARIKLLSIMKNMMNVGWKPTIPLNIARLRGKDMTDYLLVEDGYTTLDPSYTPTLDEWMRMRNLTSWEFYASGIFLTLTFTREHISLDPAKLGAYLLSYELTNEAEHYRTYAGRRRNEWKTVLPGILVSLAKQREQMETEFQIKGKKIDRTYTDPPIPIYLRK
jgi:hypothetical protein